MKTNLLKILIAPVVLGLLVAGCSLEAPDHPSGLETPPQSGPFAAYVAIGNSLTAGFMDSGLMEAGQASSYPRQIAMAIGLDDEQFTQPWIASPGIGSTDLGDPSVIAGVLHFDGTGLSPLGTTPAAAVMSLLTAVSQPVPYDNQGVPGATLTDGLSAYSEATSQFGNNPYFDFITRGSTLLGSETRTTMLYDMSGLPTPALHSVDYETASMAYQTVATMGRLVHPGLPQPTLVTLWLGNNDVLGGATGGNPSQANMTPPAMFATLLGDVLQLVAGGVAQATGMPPTIAVANIPNVTDVPYFITEATFQAAAGGAWPWGYEEGSAQLLTFTVLSWIANPANQGTPIPSKYTLTAAEVTLVSQYIAGYNQYIAGIIQAVNASGLAHVGLVDVNAVLAGLPTAQKTHFLLLLPQVGGDIGTAAGMTLFSLDGVHPNNRGYAVIANAFIDAINATAGTSIAHVDPAAQTWDPTYGVPVGKKVSGAPLLSEEAAAAMTAVWR